MKPLIDNMPTTKPAHTKIVIQLTELKEVMRYILVNLFSSRYPRLLLRLKTSKDEITRLVTTELCTDNLLALFLFYTPRPIIFK